MSRLPVLFAALTLPLPLWAADCPVAADLAAKGIAFETATGEVEEFRSLRPGIVESRYYYDDQHSAYSRVMLGGGLYVLELIEVSEGVVDASTRSTYGFPLAPTALPLPTAETPVGGGWTWTVAFNNSGDLGSETQVYTVQPLQSLTFGACSYEVIPVELRFLNDGPDSGNIDILHYLPALGLSYLARSIYSGGDDSYDYKSIRTLN